MLDLQLLHELKIMVRRSWLTRLLIVGVVLLQTSAATGYADRVLGYGSGDLTVGESEQPAEHFWLARPLPAGARQWIEHTFPYGSDGGGRYWLHTGVDFGNPAGTSVVAAAAGQVVYAGDDAVREFGPTLDFYGKLVLIELGQPYCPSGVPATEPDHCQAQPVYVLYGHLSQVFVAVGQNVQAGELIGAVGMTGVAIGPHLHLEVRVGQEVLSATRNPALWLRPANEQGVIAGRLLDAEGRDVRDDRLLVYRVRGDARLWRVVRTYPEQSLINSDDAWHENFVLADVPPGEYLLVAGRGARTVRAVVNVTAGHMSFVEMSLPVGTTP